MYTERHVVAVTTAADGTATAYTPVVSGRVLAIHYLKTDFTDGVDFTVTAEATGEGLWTEVNVNAAKSVYPRAAVHDVAGVAATLDGTRAMRDAVALAHDRVKIVVAAGGAAKTGTFHVVIG